MPLRLAHAMRALGKDELPGQIRVRQFVYTLDQTIKHDFFAATGFYKDTFGNRAVGKFGRRISFYGLPTAWIGRWLVAREVHFYTRLSDVPNVPQVLERAPTYFLHEYVPGKPLKRGEKTPDLFFAQLRTLLEELHRREIAYVDTNKPENILLGEDEKPHLIDFQISWDLMGLGNNFVNRWWLRRLQRGDLYHILKHKKRIRPDQFTEEDRKALENRGVLINLHRLVTKPYFVVRRKLFKWMRAKGWLLPEGSK